MKTKFLFISLALASLVLLSACGAPASQPPTGTPAQVAASATAAAGVSPAPTVHAAVDQCVACHTDKQKLIDTAKPAEAAESESKGVG